MTRHPRLFVDFQNADVHGRVRLSCQGTLSDLQQQQIELREGLALTLYEDDADENGRPQLLVVEGTVEYSDEERLWVARIDWDAVQAVPQTSLETSNGSPSTQASTRIVND